MDFLDPKRQHAQKVRLITGYILMAIAILLATVVLLYLTFGFSLNSQGKIIQNGFVFVSSTPSGSTLLVNGKPTTSTDARLTLAAGNYDLQIERTGYRTWQRAVTVEGGTVVRFDYPILFPINLTTTTLNTYSSQPNIVSESLNRQYLLVQHPGSMTSFDLYDLNKSSNSKPSAILQPTVVTIPNGILSGTTAGSQSLTVVAWANDNDHVLLEHTYDNNHKYILFDTQNPNQSVNLTKTLSLDSTSTLTLENEDYNDYFVYDSKTTVLGTASLSNPSIVPMVQYVQAYKTYGSNVVLYATTQDAPAGKAKIMLYQNGQNYFIRDVNQSSTYLLNLTQYSGSWYIAAGVPSENAVYVYQDPATVLQNNPNTILLPAAILHVSDPNYLAFSTSAQFIMAENGNSFSVYDVEYDKQYTYTVPEPLDSPQPHATWMDGSHLTYVSGGKVLVFDYDGTNQQSLEPADPAYLPFFSQGYNFAYAMAPASSSGNKKATGEILTTTSLLTPADQ